jgi:diguanylate cyclase (GGDEF)-like protein
MLWAAHRPRNKLSLAKHSGILGANAHVAWFHAADRKNAMTSDDPIADSRPEAELACKLQQSQHYLDQMIQGGRWLVWTSVVIGTLDQPGSWAWSFRRDVSPIMPEWFDVDRTDGESLSTVLQRARLPEDTDQCHRTCGAALVGGAPGYTQMFRVRLRDGRVSWVEENVAIVPVEDNTWRLVGICIDATERKESEVRLQSLQDELVVKQAELMAQNGELHALRDRLELDKAALAQANARLESLATTDGLTGTKNHRAFQVQLDKEWKSAKRYRRPLSLVMLDIDHFKPFNDTFGHPAGDDVLKRVGQILMETVRQTDCLARYGGEEFVIILPRAEMDGAISLAERFRANIEQHRWGSRAITASIGVTTLSSRHRDSQALILEADKALYRAKTDGRNCVRHIGRTGIQKAA